MIVCSAHSAKKFGRSIPEQSASSLRGKSLRSSRPLPSIVPKASNGGSGGSGGSGAGNGGSGGGGGDNDKGEDKNEFFLLKGWRERVAADPLFTRKVLIEQVIGVSASVVGDMSSRPNFGLNELDFVFSTLIVGSVLNFTLMWLLAPTAAAATTGSLFQRAITGELLASWGMPAGYMFQPGPFSFGQRVGTFIYKGLQFGVIGVAAGFVGTTATNGLLELRKKLNPSFATTVDPPNVVLNALTWGAHMAFSSNVRYQTLNMVDAGVAKLLQPTAFTAYSALIRTINNIAGGWSFAFLAKVSGVQKSQAAAPPPPAPAPAPAAKGGAKKK